MTLEKRVDGIVSTDTIIKNKRVDESLSDILDALSQVSGFRYHLEGDKYIIEK